jgi:hypothetical protein
MHSFDHIQRIPNGVIKGSVGKIANLWHFSTPDYLILDRRATAVGTALPNVGSNSREWVQIRSSTMINFSLPSFLTPLGSQLERRQSISGAIAIRQAKLMPFLNDLALPIFT